MSNRLSQLGWWARDNWIEILLIFVLLAAVWWLIDTGRALLTANESSLAVTPIAEGIVATPPPDMPVGLALRFDANQALAYASAQTALGPRPSGSSANAATAALIADELMRLGWSVETQAFERDGLPLRNVIAKVGAGDDILLIATHFDTRLAADRDADPARRMNPVTGANGSASAVAVLLELARTLDTGLLDKQVWLAFFDGGDNADLEGWAAAVGATHMAESLQDAPERPQAMVLVNTVGAEDQHFRFDPNSDPQLSAALWQLAAAQGSGEWFIPQPGEALIDDHLPFRAIGIPVAAIVGADYPYRYTTEDNSNQLSADSLRRVGELLEAYIKYSPIPGEGDRPQ